MVEKFDLSREHFEKEWWRERRIAPATFFGFPDITKQGLRGGSLYVEQMDSVTLAVLADKCLKERIWDPDIWSRFSWRAQQIVSRTHEPDLCYIFRAFARADWFDQNLLTTYLGRLHRRLHAFQLPDVAVLLEAFANPKFRQSTYLQKALTHLTLLLQHRDDAGADDLARSCAALRLLRPLSLELSREVLGVLELLAEALLFRDLSELGPGRTIQVLDCYVSWGFTSREQTRRSSASIDLCWTLARALRGQLQEHSGSSPDDLATLALALATGGLSHAELWEELVYSLETVAYRMSGASVAATAFGVAKVGFRSPGLYAALARRLGEHRWELSPLDCARAAGGFLRCPAVIADSVVMHGPVSERILEIGFDAFDAEAMVLLLESLSHAHPAASGVETLAGALLEALYARLEEFSLEQLASVARSVGRLRPADPKIICAIFDRAQPAMEKAASSDGDGFPRSAAMLCQGVAAQPQEVVHDVPARLARLLPAVMGALAARPTAIRVTQLFHSLVRCPATPERSDALDACAKQLVSGAHDLSAPALASLAKSLAALASPAAAGDQHWVSAALRGKVAQQLEIKRYDLLPGTLWRAAEALELAGAEPGALRLEPRDEPR